MIPVTRDGSTASSGSALKRSRTPCSLLVIVGTLQKLDSVPIQLLIKLNRVSGTRSSICCLFAYGWLGCNTFKPTRPRTLAQFALNFAVNPFDMIFVPSDCLTEARGSLLNRFCFPTCD